jgi:electron transfer flavoprotein alpha subunit
MLLPLDLTAGRPKRAGPDAVVIDLLEPDPATMDLADATRVVGGGAGLVPRGATDQQARAVFTLLADVAAALAASIGTTGVAIDPDLYLALGISGATQHTGGLGTPRHIVSVNTDPSCPMTAMADLGLVTDALGLLIGLAERLGVEVPAEVKEIRA